MNSDGRAASEILGFIMVFALVLSSIALVSTVGLDQISNVRDVEQMNNVEDAFDLLATNVDDVARRGAPSRSTEIQLATGQLELVENVEVRFEAIEHGGATVVNQSYDVRPIVYRGSTSDRAVVYAGGAIFRTNADGGTTVRKPPFVAGDGRVSIPLIHTRSSERAGRGGGTARVRASHSQTMLLATDAQSRYERVFVNVTSPRARLWYDTLSNGGGFECHFDESGSTDRAACFVTEPDRVHVSLVQVDLALND